ncbi:glycosyltransferase family 4 protein [Flavobacterium sp.]|jgi:glycosyltransferase involved in cell wall biosynthesis|uniref:glycosyltransferase family 4 protein n=1 Tax=Flavobacterium sp. TaxID=239 RepID=UPI002A81D55C|nr:glycosyltransferase family 4 protein [Flavobacterium sp.]
MTDAKPYIVVHAGRRDDYQIALALQEHNQLYFLVTEAYFPLDNFFFKKVACFFGTEKKFALRFKEGLPSEKVIISYRALFFELLFQLTKNVNFDRKKGYALGLKAKKISQKNNVPIIAVNTCAYDAFFNNPIHPKILFQFHPHISYVKTLFDQEIGLNPKSKNTLMQEYEYSLPNDAIQKLKNEISLATNYICASSVTKKTLEFEGVKNKLISVIPYGVDVSKFQYAKRQQQEIFNIIFIGSLNQRKGITYLLEAMNGLSNVSLTIIGRGIFDENLLAGYHFPIEVFKNVSQDFLIEKLQKAHCFVLPSVLEGFGQVILEAMATGIPVITTENTAGLDIITNAEDGYVVPIRDVHKITTIIKELQSDFTLVNSIGHQAHLTAQAYNWEKFRSAFVQHLNSIAS